MLLRWFYAFVFTQAIEAPIYARAIRGAHPTWRRRRALASGLLPSLVTHPLVWLAFNPLRRQWGLPYEVTVLALELAVVGAETGILHRLKVRRPLLWSALANAASVVFGELSRSLFHFP